MPDLRARIAALCHMSGAAAERALADAVEYALPEEQPPVAAELLKRGPTTPTGSLALLRILNRLPGDLRKTIIKDAAVANETLVTGALAFGDSQTRINTLAILDARAVSGLFSDCLQPNLEHSSPAVREAAAAWLLRVSLLLWRKRQTHTNSEIRDLDRAVADACLSYPDHRQDDVLLAASLLSQELRASKTPKLHAWLADEAHASHFACRGALKRLNRTQLSRTIFEWLGCTRLAAQSLMHLNELARSETHLPQILKSSHLALLPAQRRRLTDLSPRRPAVVDQKQTFTASSNKSDLHSPALARWIRTVPMPEAERIDRLADAQICPDTGTRLAAVYHLGRLATTYNRLTEPCPGIESKLADALYAFCHDPDTRVAELAFFCLYTHTKPGRHTISAADAMRWTSCHPSIRQLASALTEDRSDFETLWQIWTDTSLTPEVRAVRCRTVAQAGQTGEIVNDLRQQLAPHHPPSTLLSTMRLIICLHQVPLCELELLTLTQHTDSYVIATAVRLLATLARASHSCSQAVAAMLQHPDPRVRANAIESLDAPLLSTPVVARLLTASASSSETHNRVRANAVTRLFSVNPDVAAQHLDAMLRDRQPTHRVSALWILESKQQPPACLSALAEIAADDPVPQIRTRARRVARQMLTRQPSDRRPTTREDSAA